MIERVAWPPHAGASADGGAGTGAAASILHAPLKRQDSRIPKLPRFASQMFGSALSVAIDEASLSTDDAIWSELRALSHGIAKGLTQGSFSAVPVLSAVTNMYDPQIRIAPLVSEQLSAILESPPRALVYWVREFAILVLDPADLVDATTQHSTLDRETLLRAISLDSRRLNKAQFVRFASLEAAPELATMLFDAMLGVTRLLEPADGKAAPDGISVLAFLAFAAGFSVHAPVLLRYALLFRAVDRDGGREISREEFHYFLALMASSSVSGLDLASSLGMLRVVTDAVFDSIFEAPAAPRAVSPAPGTGARVRRAAEAKSRQHDRRPAADQSVSWPDFTEALYRWEERTGTELNLSLPSTVMTERWRRAGGRVVRAGKWSAREYNDEDSLRHVLLAASERLGLAGNKSVEVLYAHLVEQQHLSTVGQVRAMARDVWAHLASGPTPALPAGMMTELERLDVCPAKAPAAAPKRVSTASTLASTLLRVTGLAWLMHVASRLDRVAAFWLVFVLAGFIGESAVTGEKARQMEAHRLLGSTLVLAKITSGGLRWMLMLMFVPLLDTLFTWAGSVPLPLASWLGAPSLTLRGLFPTREHLFAFHKFAGLAVLVLGLVHSACHVYHAHKIAHASQEQRDAAFPPGSALASMRRMDNAGLVLFGTWLSWSGWILLVCFLAIVLTARSGALKSRTFETFYAVHHLFIVAVIVIGLHPTTWRTAQFIWTSCGLYVLHRIWSACYSLRSVPVVALRLERGNAVRIDLAKSAWMKRSLHLGAFIWLNIPALSRWQWHPFSVASSPEADTVRVYCRVVGAKSSWTNALKALARAPAASPASPIIAHIAGPFGTDSRRMMQYRHVVLAASGIGVTPYAAVVQELLISLHLTRQTAVQDVHFWWIVRDLDAFSWFAEQLAELDAALASSLSPVASTMSIDLRIFVTSASPRTGETKTASASTVLQHAIDTLYARYHIDFLTRLSVPTVPGRPHVRLLLGDLVSDNNGSDDTAVFYCGHPALGDQFRAACAEHKVEYYEEIFG